MAFQASRMP
uniref:Uncharacterized protein n=1 Tax=Rhizophora mucronata TaxID=61149 RepID=A0A2P2P3M3_RHIMU